MITMSKRRSSLDVFNDYIGVGYTKVGRAFTRWKVSEIPKGIGSLALEAKVEIEQWINYNSYKHCSASFIETRISNE